MINKYVYFATGDGANAAGEAVMLPVANLCSMKIQLDDELDLTFADLGTAHNTDVSTISLIHKTGHSMEAMEQCSNAFTSNPKDGFIVLADVDEVTGTKTFFSPTSRKNVLTDAEISL